MVSMEHKPHLRLQVSGLQTGASSMSTTVWLVVGAVLLGAIGYGVWVFTASSVEELNSIETPVETLEPLTATSTKG